MIEQTHEWTSSDATALKNFLATQTGRRLLAQLASEKPVLLGAGETNSILIRCGEARQHDDLLGKLINLAGGALEEPTTDPTAQAYPPLTDDEAWADGQKINPETQE
jgi:hypothetical protein